MADATLKELGVKTVGHRLRICAALRSTVGRGGGRYGNREFGDGRGGGQGGADYGWGGDYGTHTDHPQSALAGFSTGGATKRSGEDNTGAFGGRGDGGGGEQRMADDRVMQRGDGGEAARDRGSEGGAGAGATGLRKFFALNQDDLKRGKVSTINRDDRVGYEAGPRQYDEREALGNQQFQTAPLVDGSRYDERAWEQQREQQGGWERGEGGGRSGEQRQQFASYEQPRANQQHDQGYNREESYAPPQGWRQLRDETRYQAAERNPDKNARPERNLPLRPGRKDDRPGDSLDLPCGLGT